MKKYAPYIVAIVTFLVLSVVYFAPQFSGEQLYQHDIVQYEGSSKDILEHKELYGEDPQWEGRMFGGMPSYFINFSYSGVIPTYMAQGAYRSIGEPASLILLAFVGFYLMLLLFKVDPWSALPASLAYGLSSYFFIIIAAGHITKMAAMGLAPLAVGGVYYALRENKWLGASITALSSAMLIGVNHPQIAYYFVMIIAAMWISELVRAYKKKLLKDFALTTVLLAAAGLLAMGANSQLLWYSFDSSKDTMRAGSELAIEGSGQDSQLDLEYATAWSYGKYETLNLFVPNATGGSSSGGFSENGPVAQSLVKYNARDMATSLPGYFGAQPMTSGPVYIGAVAIFIFVLGMFLLCGYWRWWIMAISIISIFLAWGHNMMWFTELFYNYVPLYGKFRTVSMILVIVEWTVPFAAALTLAKIINSGFEKERVIKALKYTTAICGGVALLMLALGGSLVDFSSAVDAQLPDDVVFAMRSERASMLTSDALRSLIFVLLAGASVYFFVVGRIKKCHFVAAVSLLVVVDMIPVNLRYLSGENFEPRRDVLVAPTAADRTILADPAMPAFRVFNTTVSPFNDATTSYYHRSVGGYHGAKLGRYQDLIDNHLSKMNMEVLNMLNTKYFIGQLEEGGEAVAQFNPDANGAAWFVEAVAVVDGPRAEIDALNNINTLAMAVVDREFEAFVNAAAAVDSTATIDIVDYKVNHLTYKYSSSEDLTAVFSEIYYPKGWKAYIDGVETPYFRANYILRAMNLPRGEHTVEFKFEAPHFDTLGGVSLASSLIILVSLIGFFVKLIIKRNGTTTQNAE